MQTKDHIVCALGVLISLIPQGAYSSLVWARCLNKFYVTIIRYMNPPLRVH